VCVCVCVCVCVLMFVCVSIKRRYHGHANATRAPRWARRRMRIVRLAANPFDQAAWGVRARGRPRAPAPRPTRHPPSHTPSWETSRRPLILTPSRAPLRPARMTCCRCACRPDATRAPTSAPLTRRPVRRAQNLQYFFGAPVSPEKLKDYVRCHARTEPWNQCLLLLTRSCCACAVRAPRDHLPLP